MKIEYINPFIKAINDVFKMMLGLNIEKKDLKIQEEIICKNDTKVVLGITGDLQGDIIFRFPKNMALEMVKNMSGLEVDEINRFVSSALGEVVNIVSGNAVTILSQEGYSCDIVPPKVFINEDMTFNLKDEHLLHLILKTDIGEFELNLNLKEKSKE